MAYYLILCFISMASYAAIIGWRKALRWDSIAGFYLFAFFLTFFLRPWYIYQSKNFAQFYHLGVTPFQGWWSLEWLAVKMGLAIILGLVCFALAYRKVAPGIDNLAAISDHRRISPILLRKLKFFSLFLCALGTICILIYMPFPGLRDISVAKMAYVGHGNYGGFGYTNTTAYVALGEKFIIPGSVLFFLVTGNMGGTLFLSLPFILERLWFGWSRGSLVDLAVALVLAVGVTPFLDKREKSKALFLSVSILVLTAGVFGILGEDRNAVQSYVKYGSGAITHYNEATEAGYLNSLVGFEPSLHWLKYTPDVFPYEWGAEYGYKFLILPIPRILWPGKRQDFFAPTKYVDTRYLLGCAPGCIGEGWYNGGWLGISIIFAMAGAFCGWVQRARNWKFYPMTGLLIFLGCYPLVITLIRDGPSTLGTDLYFLGVPFLMVYLIERHYFMATQVKEIKMRRIIAPHSIVSASGGAKNQNHRRHLH